METAEYWPMAREYGIWNAAIASLQFWAEDLDPVTLGDASECIYNHFFWTPTSHTLCQLPKETLFGCFVLALNAAFTQQLSLEDEGYESGSNEDVPTPLHVKCHTYTMCPVWNMLLSTPYTALRADQLPVIPHTHLPDQCDAIFLSMMTV